MKKAWYRNVRTVALSAALILGAMSAAPASAQVCPYNSTQGSCACPTSGGGTTCFGGQLYRSTDSSCQADARPCAANQQWNCSTESCACNTTSYPCGGCTAATSTVGATCNAPTNGKYTNVCGACACPAGTTLCGASNTCVTNLSCPAGTTFDPCTNTCGTPYVLLNPSQTQSGAISIDNNVTTTGNIFLGGDFYIPNGKAIRVDGAGVTSLNIGNWGGGGTGVNVNFPATSKLCFGATCRNSWPSATDFNPTYINTTGDTMTGDLTLSGVNTDLFVGGREGVGTTTPSAGLEVAAGSFLVDGSGVYPTWAGGNGMFFYTDKGALRAGNGSTSDWSDVNIGNYSMALGRSDIASGTSSFAAGEFNQATGDRSVALGGNSQATGTSTVALGNYAVASSTSGYGSVAIGNSVTASGKASVAIGLGISSGTPLVNNLDNSFMVGLNSNVPTLTVTGASGAVNSLGNVGIGTSAPSARLDVNGTARMTGFQLTTGAGAGKFLTSDASGNGSWQAANFVTSVSGSGSGISVSPTTGSVVVSNTGVTSVVAGNDTTVSAATGSVTIGDSSTLQTVTNRGSTTTNTIHAGSTVNTGIDAQGNTTAVAAQTWGNNANAVYANALNGGSNNTAVWAQGTSKGVDAVGGTYGVSAYSAGGTGVYTNGGSYGLYSAGGSNYLAGRTGVGVAPSGTYTLSSGGTYSAQFGSPSGAYVNVFTGGNSNMSLSDGYGHDAGFIGGGQNGSAQNTLTLAGCADGGSCPRYMTLNQSGNVEIGYGSSPAATLAVGGDGSNVYGTDLWVENNEHVQGNESVGGYRGRLRVGTAFNTPGIYAETNSGGGISDLVLGASSNHVWINAGSFGSPTHGSTLELWGSRLSDTGSGILTINSGGNITDLHDPYVYVNGTEALQNNGDGWLRLNQAGAFASGVHTPGNFAPGALNVGGANGWGNPGGGNMWVAGSDTNYGNLWVGGQITSNYYQSWWYADAYNGGQGGPTTTSAPISTTMCVNIKTDIWGQWGGRCDIWDNGTYWVFGAYSYSNPGSVHCIWRCYKYK